MLPSGPVSAFTSSQSRKGACSQRGEKVHGIKITANGFEMEVPRETTLEKLLDILEETVRPDVIVELNRKFVHLNDYSATFLKEGDDVEVIHLEMGG